jgi:hypothetical protein
MLFAIHLLLKVSKLACAFHVNIFPSDLEGLGRNRKCDVINNILAFQDEAFVQ